VSDGTLPSPFVPLSFELADRMAEKLDGEPIQLLQESLAGIPSTAHILGGAVMGADPEQGVIDRDHHVFGYRNMLVCDGSVVSANIGVNPSLTITALAERAMRKIPPAHGDARRSDTATHVGYAEARVSPASVNRES
jgi:cholesterol oxidase